MKTKNFYALTIVIHISTCNINIPNDRNASVVSAISVMSFNPISLFLEEVGEGILECEVAV